MNFVIPMFESERGWGSKIDGYVGPFETLAAADLYRKNYNKKYNNDSITPDYYIMALEPVPNRGQTCDYRLEQELLQTTLAV